MRPHSSGRQRGEATGFWLLRCAGQPGCARHAAGTDSFQQPKVNALTYVKRPRVFVRGAVRRRGARAEAATAAAVPRRRAAANHRAETSPRHQNAPRSDLQRFLVTEIRAPKMHEMAVTAWVFGGALGRIRTSDPRNRNPMLYPAELRARVRSIIRTGKSPPAAAQKQGWRRRSWPI
jgi:hypothetical protein